MKPKRGGDVLRKGCVITLTVIAAVLSAIFAAQGTLAWMNHSDSKDNRLSVMQYIFSLSIQEDFDPPAPSTNLAGTDVVDKKSWVANDGDIPSFVRVKVFPVLTSKPDPLQPGKHLYFEARFGAQLHYVGLNTIDWTDGGDGWFYYLKVVPPGGQTEPLFQKVELDGDIATYADANLTITLIAEAVETRKYDSGTKYHYKEAWWDNTMSTDRASVAFVLDPLAMN